MKKMIFLLVLIGLTPMVNVFAHEGSDDYEMNNDETGVNPSESGEIFPQEEIPVEEEPQEEILEEREPQEEELSE